MLIRWASLLALSILATASLDSAGFPAASLLGPMSAAIALALTGQDLQVPASVQSFAQGFVGLMIGASFPKGFLGELAGHWPLFLAGTWWTILVSTLLSLLLARSRMFPGTTALWGISAGAASVMTFMSRDHGADFRLVAFMQYLRVVLVALAAGLMVRLSPSASGVQPVAEGLPSPDWPMLGLTLLLAAALSRLGARLPLPGGSFLLPMAIGAAAVHGFGLQVMPPPLLKAVVFGIIGWAIGLRFSPALLGHAARVLPVVTLMIVVMILLNCGFAVVLSRFGGIDLLTAALATSPGGADAVAIIAAGVPVDVGFVMTMQTARLLIVLLLAPVLATRLSRFSKG